MTRKNLIILIVALAVVAAAFIIAAVVTHADHHDAFARGPGGMMPGFGHERFGDRFDGAGRAFVLPWLLLATLVGLGGGLLIAQPWRRAVAGASSPVAALAPRQQFETWHREAHAPSAPDVHQTPSEDAPTEPPTNDTGTLPTGGSSPEH